MSPYELIEHTADIAVRVSAPSIEELFRESAQALFDILCDVSTIENSVSFGVEVEADSAENMLHDWLSELLLLHESEEVLLRDFRIALEGSSLKASVSGEIVDTSKHKLKTSVKGITYHMLAVRRDRTGFSADILFDV